MHLAAIFYDMTVIEYLSLYRYCLSQLLGVFKLFVSNVLNSFDFYLKKNYISTRTDFIVNTHLIVTQHAMGLGQCLPQYKLSFLHYHNNPKYWD